MIDQVHWWLAALSFGFGLVLTYTLMVRPAWAVVVPAPTAKSKPPAMKTTAAEAPTKKLPTSSTGPAKKKAASDRPPTKRGPVPPPNSASSRAAPPAAPATRPITASARRMSSFSPSLTIVVAR